MIFRVILALSILSYTYAECLNACSQHGTCGAYDMCTCDKNFMANDCSQRICQFGVSHSDNAKGDLNADGTISGPDELILKNAQVYPHGTTEQYPSMLNSVGIPQGNSAHDYMECSNKGICDRTTGTCVCFEGYGGSACQRTSCPSTSGGECSGNGQCRTIEQIADLDYNNVYTLWDKKSTMGCVCDAGYSGIDCSQKICKKGFDPLYANGPETVRYTNVTYSFFTKRFQGVTAATVSGNYSLILTDGFGKTWTTKAIDFSTGDCDVITDAIESLPNMVFPVDSVLCHKWAVNQITNAALNPIVDDDITVQAMFTLAFPGNPGYLPQLRITKYTEGTRATLVTDESVPTLNWHIFANGFIGEDIDFVPDLCEGLIVDLTQSGSVFSFNLDADQANLLKKCLGDADGDSSNNVDVQNWQHGSIDHPHLIKLVDANQYPNPAALLDQSDADEIDAYDYPKTTLCSKKDSFLQGTGVHWCPNKDSPGFYATLTSTGSTFSLLTRGGLPYLIPSSSTTTKFYVFTTKGYLSKIDGVTAYAYNKETDTNSSYYLSNVMYYGNVSLTGYGNNDQGVGSWPTDSNLACTSTKTTNCIDKNDYVMFLNDLAANNPVYPNIYKVGRVGIDAKMSRWELFEKRHTITVNYGVNSNFYAGAISAAPNTPGVVANIYKFTPPSNGYLYAAQCSTRGICDTTSGICSCFAGYTGDSCDRQNALAL